MAQRCSDKWIQDQALKAIPREGYDYIAHNTPVSTKIDMTYSSEMSSVERRARRNHNRIVDKYNEIKARCDRQKAEKKVAEISAKTTKKQLTPVLGAIDDRFNASWIIGGIAIILIAAAGYYFYDLTK